MANLISSMLIIPNLLFLFFFEAASGVESITRTQSLTDGKTLVSSEGSFELGFFSPGSSKNRYLGIWFKNIPVKTVVWVANRSSPINDSSGSLMINTSSLLLLGQNKLVVWSTTSSRQAQNPLLQLLDSGNLVLRDEKNANSEDYLWQSFDYPTDTLLAGMKLGWDLRRGLNRRLTAWKNRDDPSPGDFTFELEIYSYPESYIWKGSVKYYRTGPWNGLGTSGSPSFKPNQLYEYKFVSNEDEVYYTYNLKNKAMKSMAIINQSNYAPFQRCVWLEAEKTWETYSSSPKDHCDSYNLCGANGNCLMTESPVCQCLKGFKPKSQKNWEIMDWTQGCVRNTPLSCPDKDKDKFVKFVGLKVPDTTHSWVDTSMNLKECSAKCLNNCSCMAYTNSDIRGRGSGCAIWFGDLLDIRQFPTGGQTLYVRLQASELADMEDGRKKRTAAIVVASVAVVSGMLLVYIICRSRKSLKERSLLIDQSGEVQEEDMELPVLDLSTISRATDGFSIANKLGEGGFGPVYRGVLADGLEVAVKRLSKISGQGPNEFRNEVKLIAKLQHRNLVKLLGCCIEGEEKMLVYEYMPNKSLDSFLFDQTRGRVLDWSKRFQIICGIARGLLYLHQDSRLRIIHRDLKASNVLLDSELKPKISDFGMAKTFGGDQTEGNTNRVVGTYGYMAPEYAFDGLFSTKSDVFSFGILLLEIVSGKKSRGLYNQEHNLNLIGYAWKLWSEGRPLDLLDACLGDSVSASEALRCVHVSLLCGQQRPEDRPDMSSVVLMLGSEIALPQPTEPGFLMEKYSRETFSSSSYKHESSSTNEISISLEAR